MNIFRWTVNHIKGIVTDNTVKELEWNTDSENNLHAFSVLGRINSQLGRTGAKNAKSKKVKCLNNGIVYDGLNEAARQLGCLQGMITRVCQGKRKKHRGYVFEYYTS